MNTQTQPTTIQDLKNQYQNLHISDFQTTYGPYDDHLAVYRSFALQSTQGQLTVAEAVAWLKETGLEIVPSYTFTSPDKAPAVHPDGHKWNEYYTKESDTHTVELDHFVTHTNQSTSFAVWVKLCGKVYQVRFNCEPYHPVKRERRGRWPFAIMGKREQNLKNGNLSYREIVPFDVL